MLVEPEKNTNDLTDSESKFTKSLVDTDTVLNAPLSAASEAETSAS